jgi:hypothetical protein
MILGHPKFLILIGFFLVLAGAVLPFLMVTRVLASTFLLNFTSFGATMAGLLLGMVGAATYVRVQRK